VEGGLQRVDGVREKFVDDGIPRLGIMASVNGGCIALKSILVAAFFFSFGDGVWNESNKSFGWGCRIYEIGASR
jgi:hypothetical protein